MKNWDVTFYRVKAKEIRFLSPVNPLKDQWSSQHDFPASGRWNRRSISLVADAVFLLSVLSSWSFSIYELSYFLSYRDYSTYLYLNFVNYSIFQVEEMSEFFFNIDHGYLEALIRGFKSGLLTASDYQNLVQCETLEG